VCLSFRLPLLIELVLLALLLVKFRIPAEELRHVFLCSGGGTQWKVVELGGGCVAASLGSGRLHLVLIRTLDWWREPTSRGSNHLAVPEWVYGSGGGTKVDLGDLGRALARGKFYLLTRLTSKYKEPGGQRVKNLLL
jgi:hypothetical protein